MSEISKAKLLSVLSDCANQKISVEQLQVWVIHNYDPPEAGVAKAEAEHTKNAMDMVMNEYELVDLDKVRLEGLVMAMDFIACEAHEFDAKGKRFIREGFLD